MASQDRTASPPQVFHRNGVAPQPTPKFIKPSSNKSFRFLFSESDKRGLITLGKIREPRMLAERAR